MITLFNCRSLIPLNEKYSVQCYWFCVDRKQPVLGYQELINGYDPNKEGIDLVENGVNECFSEHEINLLETHLAKYGVRLEGKKANNLPVNSDYIGLGESPLGGGAGLIKLNEKEGYDLPFKVWGYYDYKDPQDLVMTQRSEVSL